MLDRVPNTPLPLFRLSLYFPVFSSFKYSISYNLTGINMSRSTRMIPQVIYHQSLIILIELLVVFLITTLFMQTLRYHPGFAFFSMVIWDEVFKNGASKIFRIHPSAKLYNFFKGCIPQILLVPFLNIFPVYIF